MKLTGKAKEDFYNWHSNKINPKINWKMLSLRLTQVVQNALITEWFDSTGLYIFPAIDCFHFGYYIYIDGHNEPEEQRHGFNNRLEAINNAIEKANEIYNQNN